MKASDLFVRCLEREGTEYVFCVPGEENLDLLESLRTSSIRLIVNRHEQAAAFMAAGYARMTGKTGVCLATLGPGATNLVTGIAHAQLSGVPLLAITGQKGIRENRQADFQLLDIVSVMRPITKRTIQIQDPKMIPTEVREAFKVATAERLGACHIELPEDVANESVPAEFRPLDPGWIRRPVVEASVIEAAAEMIRRARDPILIVSSRGQRRRVHESLRRFCDATNIFVIHTQLGKGALGDDHPNSLFSFGVHRHDHLSAIVEGVDLIITVGYSTNEYPPRLWNPRMDKPILRIDFSVGKTQAHYNPRIELIGDIATTLDRLRERLADYRYAGDTLARLRQEFEQRLHVEGADDTAFPLRPRRIVAECRRALGREDVLCLDNGIYKLWFSRHYPVYDIGTFILDNSLATMGAGMPLAMAAKLVRPDRRVLAVVGDGGFLMNSQELETAVRLGIAVVVLILNDNAYGFIKWEQQSHGFPDFGLDLHNPVFCKYAEAYGTIGYCITAEDQLRPALEEAFQQNRPVLIDCPIDYSENKDVWVHESGARPAREKS
ncbi:MAG: acetolactate synthase large subunit [Candidatus Eisenbacteria bacterium]|nr:acetolactate synthase large subunit [Candidatus Eisenbacteria bacterium]